MIATLLYLAFPIIFVVRQTLILTLTCDVFIELYVKKYARNRKRAACMFFRSAKNVFISPRYNGLADRVHSRITKLHAMSMRPYTTVDDRAHCNRGQPNRRIAVF